MVKFTTNQILATLSVNATLETAYGVANRTLFEAEAVADTLVSITNNTATKIAEMKQVLGFENDQILEFMKLSLIKDYEAGKIVI